MIFNTQNIKYKAFPFLSSLLVQWLFLILEWTGNSIIIRSVRIQCMTNILARAETYSEKQRFGHRWSKLNFFHCEQYGWVIWTKKKIIISFFFNGIKKCQLNLMFSTINLSLNSVFGLENPALKDDYMQLTCSVWLAVTMNSSLLDTRWLAPWLFFSNVTWVIAHKLSKWKSDHNVLCFDGRGDWGLLSHSYLLLRINASD